MELDRFKNNIDVQLEDELYALVTVLWSSTNLVFPTFQFHLILLTRKYASCPQKLR